MKQKEKDKDKDKEKINRFLLRFQLDVVDKNYPIRNLRKGDLITDPIRIYKHLDGSDSIGLYIYLNSKFEALREYPPFQRRIKDIRVKYGIQSKRHKRDTSLCDLELKLEKRHERLNILKKRISHLEKILNLYKSSTRYEEEIIVIENKISILNKWEKKNAKYVDETNKRLEIYKIKLKKRKKIDELIIERKLLVKKKGKNSNKIKTINNTINSLREEIELIECGRVKIYKNDSEELKTIESDGGDFKIIVSDGGVFNNSVIINLFEYRYEYMLMISSGDDLYKSIESIINADAIKANYASEKYKFITIGYYLVFGKEISYKILQERIGEELIFQINGLFSVFQNDTEIQNKINCFRENLGVSMEDSVANFVLKYNKYNRRLSNYKLYSLSRVDFLKDIYKILEEYEFLNLENDLDYVILLMYLLTNRLWDRDDLKFIFHPGIPVAYRGEELLLGNMGLDINSIYVRFPIYSIKDYVNPNVTRIVYDVLKKYGVDWSSERYLNYYFRKHVKEVRDEYINRNNRKTKEEKKSRDDILESVFDNIIKNDYYRNMMIKSFGAKNEKDLQEILLLNPYRKITKINELIDEFENTQKDLGYGRKYL